MATRSVIGYIQEEYPDEGWEVIRIPAIAEDDDRPPFTGSVSDLPDKHVAFSHVYDRLAGFDPP